MAKKINEATSTDLLIIQDEEDLAIIDICKLFGCETGKPDYQFDMEKGTTF
jgi:hypothetical protein